MFPKIITVSAFAILIISDITSAHVGPRYGRHRFLAKSLEGTLSFFVTAVLVILVAPKVEGATGEYLIGIIAAAVGALIEASSIPLDDNISVPASAGVVLWLCSLVTAAAWTSNRDAVAANLPPALVVNTVAATGGWLLRTVRVSGMLAGWAIGVAVFASLGIEGWSLLFLTFLTATVTSRLGLKRKALLGIAEEHGGQRGGGTAFANT